jgi:hypothetical protein
MSVLELALVPDRTRPQELAVAVRFDGEPLTEPVRRVEAPHRRAVGADPAAGRYTWVRAEVMLLPRRHLLGVPASPWCPGFSEVLICTCGEAACGAIAVSVRVWPRHVGWLAWRQFPLAEASPLCEFRPLVFGRSQYEAELARVSEEYRLTRAAADSARRIASW